MSRESLVENATVVQVWKRLVSRLQASAKEARTVRAIRQLQGQEVSTQTSPQSTVNETSVPEERTDTTPETDPETAQADAEEPVGETTTGEPQSGETEAGGRLSQFSQNARVYRGLRRGKRLARSSWLYRWLTKEPEPEVIVIDLRETRSVGPVLTRLNWVIRELLPGVPTSTLVQLGYRTRQRFLDRPLRLVSFGVSGLLLVLFGVIAVGGGEIGAEILLLVGLFVLALRGTQSTLSWDELTDSRWYKMLATAFEPPETPQSGEKD